MRRQLMCVMLTAVVMVGLAPHARAAQRTGTIRVTLDYGDDQVHDGEVTLYHVGQAGSGEYRLTETFGGGLIKEEDAMSPVLAKWLAETAEGEGEPRLLDADGAADFVNLEEGLYLLVQSEKTAGYVPIDPVLIPIPLEGKWNIQAWPKVIDERLLSPRTGQHPAPIIGAMGLVLSGLALVLCVDKIRRK